MQGHFIRDPYVNNQITNIDPVALQLLSYLPLPNQAGDSVTGNNNYVTNFSSPIEENSFSLRIDQSLPRAQKLLVRYSINDTTQTRPNLYGASDKKFLISNPTAGNDFLRQQQVTIDYTNAFSSNLLLDLNSSYIRYWIGRKIPGIGVNPTTVGLPGCLLHVATLLLPLSGNFGHGS